MPAQISWLLFQGLLPLTGAGLIYLLWGVFRYVTSANKARFDYHWSGAADPFGWLYKGSNMTPDDALEDTLDFQETVESLIASRPDLADPGRLRRFETALHRQLAKLGPTPEAARARERDAWAAAERERARKMMAFSMTVSGGVLAAILTFIIAPSAPLPVFAGMGLLGLLASKYGGPKLDRWWERRRRDQQRRFPV